MGVRAGTEGETETRQRSAPHPLSGNAPLITGPRFGVGFCLQFEIGVRGTVRARNRDRVKPRVGVKARVRVRADHAI